VARARRTHLSCSIFGWHCYCFCSRACVKANTFSYCVCLCICLSFSLSHSLSLSVFCVCVWVSVRAFQLSLRDKTKHGAEVKAKLCLSQNNAWPTRRLQLQKQHGLLCDSYTHTPTHKYTHLYKIYTHTHICNQWANIRAQKSLPAFRRSLKFSCRNHPAMLPPFPLLLNTFFFLTQCNQ